jgi:hypothetical protein
MIALRKKHPLTLVQPEVHESAAPAVRNRPRPDWRAAMNIATRRFSQKCNSPRSLRLSEADFMRVSNATVREGESHRVWPPDVVEKFRMAEVITNNGTQHYVVRDATINRVNR